MFSRHFSDVIGKTLVDITTDRKESILVSFVLADDSALNIEGVFQSQLESVIHVDITLTDKDNTLRSFDISRDIVEIKDNPFILKSITITSTTLLEGDKPAIKTIYTIESLDGRIFVIRPLMYVDGNLCSPTTTVSYRPDKSTRRLRNKIKVENKTLSDTVKEMFSEFFSF